jgi:RND family efflux transporter MFP subunit
MLRTSLITSIHVYFKVVILLFYTLIAIPSFASKLPSLVKVAKVESWEQGKVSIINCQISVPYLTAFSSESSAKLTYLLPQGSEVKQGELIAEQQSFYYLQQLTRLEQQLTITTNAFDYNNEEYNRLSTLNNNLVSATALEALLLKREQSDIKQAQVKNEIDELQYRIRHLKFFAPKNGSIIETFSEPGEHLMQGTKVLSFLAAHEKEINCKVPVSALAGDHNGKFMLFGANNQRLKINRINQIIDSTSQFATVYLSANDATLPQRLGQRLKVKMSFPNENLTRLPVDGLNLAETGDYVWRVDDKGKVAKVNVKLLSNQSGYFLVESSLKAGEWVVTLGKVGLANNQLVEVSRLNGAS